MVPEVDHGCLTVQTIFRNCVYNSRFVLGGFQDVDGFVRSSFRTAGPVTPLALQVFLPLEGNTNKPRNGWPVMLLFHATLPLNTADNSKAMGCCSLGILRPLHQCSSVLEGGARFIRIAAKTTGAPLGKRYQVPSARHQVPGARYQVSGAGARHQVPIAR